MYLIQRIVITVMGIVYTAKELRKMAHDYGFVEVRQKGSHLVVRHADGRQTSIPMYDRDMKKGITHVILKTIKGGQK